MVAGWQIIFVIERACERKLEKILVVSDNSSGVDEICNMLPPDLGYQSVLAPSGESALEVIQTEKYNLHLLLLDWNLPDMGCIDLLEEICRQGMSFPAIVLVDEEMETIPAAAIHLGVHDILYRPVEPNELINLIDSIFESKRLKDQKSMLTTRLKEQYIWMTALNDAGRYIVSSMDLDEIVLRSVEAGINLTYADQGAIALLNGDAGKIHLRAYKSLTDNSPQLIETPIQNSLIDSVVSTGKPIRISKGQSTRYLNDGTGMLVDSLIHVPICNKAEVFGALTVSRLGGGKLTCVEEAKLISIADYTAIAIKNAQEHGKAARQIDDHLTNQRQLLLDQERHSLASSAAVVGLWDWDFKQNHVYFYANWKAVAGYDEEDIGQTVHDWLEKVHPNDQERVKLELAASIDSENPRYVSEYRFLNKDGTYRWILNQAAIVRDEKGGVIRLTGTHVDITDRKQREESLLYNAFQDALTGLLNRPLFLNRMEHALVRYRRKENSMFAIVTLELNEFEQIISLNGRLGSDRLLLMVGELLKKHLRSHDSIAHFGNGQYAILVEELQDEDDASRATREILDIFDQPFVLDGNVLNISASCGIAFNLADYTQADEILRDVEIAMRSARVEGKSNIKIFSPQLRDRMRAKIESGIDIRRAIENNELEIFYQPIIGFDQGNIIGFEALVRWTHPERGLIAPDEFIHVAEENGLIIDLDRWVLKNACLQIKEWQQQEVIPNPLISVSVNVSAELINENGFLDYVEETLNLHQLQPLSLKLEITERSMVKNNDSTKHLLSNLLSLGVQVQIDDFGIGYSSLGYLSHLPLEGLKIDRSFVRGILTNDRQKEIVNAIVSLTSRLNVNVVAEGVETLEQLEYLKNIGCDFGQGFLIARPLCSLDVPVWLESYSPQLHFEGKISDN